MKLLRDQSTLYYHDNERLLDFQLHFDYIKVLFYNGKRIWSLRHQEGKVFPSLIRVDVLLLTQISTVSNQII